MGTETENQLYETIAPRCRDHQDRPDHRPASLPASLLCMQAAAPATPPAPPRLVRPPSLYQSARPSVRALPRLNELQARQVSCSMHIWGSARMLSCSKISIAAHIDSSEHLLETLFPFGGKRSSRKASSALLLLRCLQALLAPQPPSAPCCDHANLAASRRRTLHSRRLADVLVITSAVRMLHWVTRHTTHSRPRVALLPVLVI